MSVINRMLSDLERRGAPKPHGGGEELVPEPPRRHRRRLPARALSLTLAVVLAGIAVALWIARGERVLAGWQSLAGVVEPEAAAPVPELVGLAFEGGDDRPRLILELTEAAGRDPRYRRSGGSATVALAARADEVMVPAPPGRQAVFRAIALEPRDHDRTRVRLEVAPAAELDLRVDGRRIVLAGRLPRTRSTTGEPAADGREGPADPVASGADDDGAKLARGEMADKDAALSDSAPAPGEGEARAAAGATGATAAAESGAAADADPASAQSGTAGSGATAESRPAAGARGTAAADAGDAGDPEDGQAQTAETVAAVESGAASGSRTASASVTSAAAAAAEADSAAEADPGEPAVRKTRTLSAGKRAQRRYREARRALNAGELGAARRLLAQAIDLDPALHPARDLLVSLLRRVGDTAAARRLLDEGVALAPGRIEYAMPLARLLVDTDELQRAAGVLARARPAGTGNAGFHALAAAVAQRRGQHEQAARDYTRALEVDGGNGLWWLGLGISLAATDRAEEARAALREARASGDLSDSLDRWAEGRIDELGGGSEG